MKNNDVQHSRCTYIESSPSARHYWQDIKEFRGLISILSWRDILVRYKQTLLGVAWVLLKPALLVFALTIVFGSLANLSSKEAIPYPLLVLAAILPWQFFANSLTEGMESIVKNQSLITKIYFPRMIIPISSAIVSLLDMLISTSLLVLAMFYYQFAPPPNLIFLPFFLLLLCLFAFGTNLWIAALTVKYRDFRLLIPFAIQFGLYITPVGFSSQIISADWRLIYSLNPMVGFIDLFRWSLLGSQTFYWPSFAIALTWTFFVFRSGLSFFKKAEYEFADII